MVLKNLKSYGDRIFWPIYTVSFFCTVHGTYPNRSSKTTKFILKLRQNILILIEQNDQRSTLV